MATGVVMESTIFYDHLFSLLFSFLFLFLYFYFLPSSFLQLNFLWQPHLQHAVV